VPSQALQIIFEMQSQMSSQKRAIKKIRIFKLQNVFFFIFFHFDPPLLHQCITFSFFIFQIETVRKLPSSALQSFCNSKDNKILFKDFLRGSKIDYKLYEPSILKGCNFLVSNLYLSIFSVTNAPRGGFHLLFEHYKQLGPPPKTASKPYFKCLELAYLPYHGSP
jgi:hypothetical protein